MEPQLRNTALDHDSFPSIAFVKFCSMAQTVQMDLTLEHLLVAPISLATFFVATVMITAGEV
jgi:hypothetical protein